MGGLSSTAQSSSPNDKPSPSSAPKEFKLNKMAQLKKSVTERHQQRQGAGDETSPEQRVGNGESLSATSPIVMMDGAGLNANSNNNNSNSNKSRSTRRRSASDTSTLHVDMGHRSLSGDLRPRPSLPSDHNSAKGSSSSIFVSKFSLPPLKETRLAPGRGAGANPPRMGRQIRSEEDTAHVTVSSLEEEPQLYDV